MEVNINTISYIEPSDLLTFLDENYGGLSVPEDAVTPEDIERFISLLGYCTNVKSFLNSLLSKLDIDTRLAKESKDKILADRLICKKTLVKNYYDMIDDISKTVSRQATLYFKVEDENKEEKRISNIQYGKRRYG